MHGKINKMIIYRFFANSENNTAIKSTASLAPVIDDILKKL